jgi:DNA repair protein RadD
VNVGVLTTGYDCPKIDMVVLIRLTMSPSLMVQMIGRGLRIWEGKENCLILDFGRNIKRHGPIDNIRLKESTDAEGVAPAKECPECHELVHAAVLLCPECGFEFPPPKKLQTPKASTAAVLASQKTVTISEHEVIDTYYSEHTKKGADESHPKTLRVTYKVGKLGMVREEWLCFEHDGGFPRQKAESWWRMRSHDPCPRTIKRVLEVIDSGGIAPTLAIQVEEKEGEKFPRVIAYKVGEVPEAVPAENLPIVLELANRRRGGESEVDAEQYVQNEDVPW